jgi:hypothetical protein
MEFEKDNKLSLIKKKVRSSQQCINDSNNLKSSYTLDSSKTSEADRSAISDIKRVTSTSTRDISRTNVAVIAKGECFVETAKAILPHKKIPISKLSSSPSLLEELSTVVARVQRSTAFPCNPTSIQPSWAIRWTCGECAHDCIPVRSESRCLW